LALAEVRQDHQPKNLPIALQRLGAEVKAGPVPIPSRGEFRQRRLRRVNVHTVGVLGDQAGKLDLGFLLRALEAVIPGHSLAGDRIALKIKLQSPRMRTAPSDTAAHCTSP
jgi:hypothetical protein